MRRFFLCLMGILLITNGGLSLNASSNVTSNVRFNVSSNETSNETSNEKLNKNTEALQKELYAQGAVLMDADSKRVLFDKNGYAPMPMASTTKILTLILALEQGNLEDLVSVSDYAASMPDVQLNIRSGEQYRLKDLLYSLMLQSHNDTAVAIAEHIGGNVENFAKLMNEKARDIGCTDAYFITPNGLDAEVNVEGVTKTHSASAADMARILSYCITDSPKKELFLEITQTQSYSFSDIEGNRQFTVNNANAFLGMMEGALTGKTGYTGQAGYCYVGALRQGERTFVVALLACGWPNHKTYKWSDTKKLMTYGLDNYTYQEIYQNIPLEPVTVIEGIPQSGNLVDVAEAEVYIENPIEPGTQMLLGNEEKVRYVTTVEPYVQAPAKKDSEVGRVQCFLGQELLFERSIKIQNTVDEIGIQWCFQRVMAYFFLN